MLVEQSVIRLASAGKRLGAFANEREQPIEGRREQLIVVLRARLLPSAQRLRFRIGELAHQILGQRERMTPQPPKQRKLARPALVSFRLSGDLLHQIAKPVGDQQRMAKPFERRELLAAPCPCSWGQHRLLVPVEQCDGLVEVAQLGDLRAQRLLQRFGAADGRLGIRNSVGRFGLQHRGKPATLRDVDDLFLRNPAQGAETVLGRRKSHHRIEGLAEDAAVRTDDRKFMHRKARRPLHHPGPLGIVRLQHRCLQQPLPLAFLGRGAQHDAGAAIAAVGFQHQ